MSLTAKLAYDQLKVNKKRTLWTLASIVLAIAILVALLGFGTSGAAGLDALFEAFEFGTGENAAVIISTSLTVMLAIIIIVASMIVISNTFRVSAGERLAQFGILKSVGATGTQIRKTVMYEALFLGGIAIPAGLGIGMLLQLAVIFMANRFVDMSAFGIANGFVFVFSAEVMLIAVVVSALVIIMSVWLPARKAAKIPAINAIKAIGEFGKIKKPHKARIISRIFGFECTLAAKQMKRSRRHFRATVLSVSISIILIMIAVSATIHISQSVRGRIAHMRMPDVWAVVTSLPGEQIGIGMNAAVYSAISRELREFDSTEVWGFGGRAHSRRQGFPPLTPDDVVWLIVLETYDYLRLIEYAGVPYGSNLLLNVSLAGDARGNFTQFTQFEDTMVGQTLTLFPHIRNAPMEYSTEAVYVTIDAEITRLPQDLIFIIEGGMIIIVPDMEMANFSWSVRTNDIDGFMEHLDTVFNRHYTLRPNEQFVHMDLGIELLFINALVDFITYFVGAFSVMLVLLGLTNVISTITASIQARKKELAILTSVGMDAKGMRRMLGFESLLSSVRALMFGLPLGLLFAYLVYEFVEFGFSHFADFGFIVPWTAMFACAAGVLAITYIIMRIAAGNLREGNIIETIRGAE